MLGFCFDRIFAAGISVFLACPSGSSFFKFIFFALGKEENDRIAPFFHKITTEIHIDIIIGTGGTCQ